MEAKCYQENAARGPAADEATSSRAFERYSGPITIASRPSSIGDEKLRGRYEKPSEKKPREKAEAIEEEDEDEEKTDQPPVVREPELDG